ncbi:MAG: hypothetical protein Kow0047_14940 [Anaerolineae bacterium]
MTEARENPLLRLLQRLNETGTLPLSQLSAEIGLPEAVIRQMLDQLSHRGWVVSGHISCQSQCAMCQVRGLCVPAQNTVWQLTEAGREVLARARAGQHM